MEVYHNGSEGIANLWREQNLLKLLNNNNSTRRSTGFIKNIDLEEIPDIQSYILKSAKSLGLELTYMSKRIGDYWEKYVFFHPIEKIALSVSRSGETIELEGYGDSIPDMEALCIGFLELFPEEPESEDVEEEVHFRFWHRFKGSAQHYDKIQECPGLESMQKNYAPSVFQKLTYLRDLDKPDSKGKVIIWHGKPGGGKTFAVRALARDWAYNKGASIEIILDPHEFLTDAAYMRQVAFYRPGHHRRCAADNPDNPIRLIILEDHAELFTSKCRDSMGLSTILNLTDGILGNDLRIVFLLTANEDIKEIDPAIKRPRRCIGVTEFKGLTRAEAKAWSGNDNSFICKLEEVYPNKQELELVDLYHIQDLLEEENTSAETENGKSAEKRVLRS